MKGVFVYDELRGYTQLAILNPRWISVQIELTSDCDQTCAGCDSWLEHKRNPQQMDLNWLVPLLWDLQTTGCQHVAFTGGDPVAWPSLPEFLKTDGAWPKKMRFTLNTALTRDLDWRLVRKRFSRVRVSLDAATDETYKKCRGKVAELQPVLRRLRAMAHPGLSTLTTIYPRNVREISDILVLLQKEVEAGLQLLKASFNLGIGPRSGNLIYNEVHSEYASWREKIGEWNLPFETSFSIEDGLANREWCAGDDAVGVRCWTGAISAHIKPNGDVYPCCLAGGEALATQQDLRCGNVFQSSLRTIQANYVPSHDYKKHHFCRESCQVKQATFNQLAEWDAKRPTFTFP